MYINSFNYIEQIPEKMPPELEYAEVCFKALKLIHEYKEIQYNVHIIDWVAIESEFKNAMVNGFNLPVDPKVVRICIRQIHKILSEIRSSVCMQPQSEQLDELKINFKGLQFDIVKFAIHYVRHFNINAW